MKFTVRLADGNEVILTTTLNAKQKEQFNEVANTMHAWFDGVETFAGVDQYGNYVVIPKKHALFVRIENPDMQF